MANPAVGFAGEHRRMTRLMPSVETCSGADRGKLISTLTLRSLLVDHLAAELATQLNSVWTLITRNPRVPAKTNMILLVFMTSGETL